MSPVDGTTLSPNSGLPEAFSGCRLDGRCLPSLGQMRLMAATDRFNNAKDHACPVPAALLP